MASTMRAAILCALFMIVVSKPVTENQEKKSYRGHKLVSVTANTPLEVEYLRELQSDMDLQLDFWKQPMLGDVHIHVDPQVEKRFLNSLERAGLSYSILQEDIQSLIDVESRSMSKKVGSRDYGSTYLPFDEIESELSRMASEYSNVMNLSSIGKSVENRDLWVVKLSKKDGQKRKAIWLEATTHAREWIVASVALGTIENLAHGALHGADQNVINMLEWFDWYIIPVHNPDGYTYSHTNDRFWRKNRQPPPPKGRQCAGVDLNRNWNANFSGEGASSNPCASTYHGTKALSEPETKALNDAVIQTQREQDVVAFISFHCYSQYILTPYGFTDNKPEDYQALLAIAENAEAVLEAHGTPYRVGTPPDILYIASGGAYDHMKYTNGIKYTYTYELRPGGNTYNGFILPEEQIVPTIIETFASLFSIAQQIHDLDTPDGHE